jgi:CRP-like cAMP-binding protein
LNRFIFSNYLTSNSGLDEKLTQSILSQCKVMKVKKGDFLLMKGDKCNHSFFVEKGLLRQYVIDDKGKEHTIQFAPENWFMVDRESAYFDLPSSYFIQAMEEGDIVLIDEDLILELSKQDVSFLEFNNRLLHNHIRHLQHRITGLLSATAEERYLDFIEKYPDLMLRVPQALIASYLGIAPESLSRVRKDLALKNQRK